MELSQDWPLDGTGLSSGPVVVVSGDRVGTPSLAVLLPALPQVCPQELQHFPAAPFLQLPQKKPTETAKSS